MSTAPRERLARTLRGDEQTAFSVELTAPADDLKLEVEGFGPVRLPVTPAKARRLIGLGQPVGDPGIESLGLILLWVQGWRRRSAQGWIHVQLGQARQRRREMSATGRDGSRRREEIGRP